MVIYIDVLVLLNFIIDYFIIQLTSRITCVSIKIYRVILSSFVASLFSLVILLPEYGAVFEMIVIVFSGILVTLIAFGFKKFLKNFFAFIGVNIIYNGLMTTIWMIFKPNGMILNNSVTYFSISPPIFILLTVIFYLIIRIAEVILRKISPYAKRCILKIKNKDKTVEINALIDTGNSIRDPYTNRQVIITDQKTAGLIFGDTENIPEFLLPVTTVNGSSLIPAYVCKSVQVNNSNIFTALIAVTEHNFSNDYKAIVNPQILEEV